MNIKLQVDTSQYEATLEGWEKQKLPYATATALTRTAKKVQSAFVDAMKSKFDRPTPYTLSGTFVKPATARNLVATVGWKNWTYKGVPASKFMLPQVEGGQRSLKSSEKWLNRKGLLPGGMVMVPGSAARMDSYGNMRRGQMVQVLSALRAFPESGYLANRARKRLASGRKLPEFFVGRPGGGRLPLGIYQRMAHGVKPILIFVQSPTYKVLIPWTSIAARTYEVNFQEEFNRAMRDMLILGPFVTSEAA